MNKLLLTKIRVFVFLVGPSENAKSQHIYDWLKIGTVPTKTDKIYFFCQHSQSLYDVMGKEIQNFEFVLVQDVNFEYIDSVKNKGTKYSILFDDSCEEICNSKAFVGIATAGRHPRSSTIYIDHNLFHRSKRGRDVELQNTHIVLLKSPHDVMQVSTFSAYLGLGAELVGWFRDATSKHYGHFLIDLWPRTHKQLRYYRNTGSNTSKFNISDQLKQSKPLDDEHTKSLQSPSVSINSPKVQMQFLSVLSKKFYQVVLRMYI